MKELKDMPGIKESELLKLGPCAICGEPIVKDIFFYRIRLERAAFDAAPVRRRIGLEQMLGSGALARVMGPEEDLAKVFDGPHEKVVHEQCAHSMRSLLQLVKEGE